MEDWKSVKGYEGYYEISSTGKVKALAREVINKNGEIQPYPERIMKPEVRKGYYRVTLSKDHKTTRMFVHRLVAYAFIGEPPEGRDLINHIDNNPSNNAHTNLEWCNHSENMIHAQKQGRLAVTQKKAGKLAGEVQTSKMFERMGKLINTYVNSWLVLPDGHLRRNHHNYWLCRCTCGTEFHQSVSRIYTKDITCCTKCARANQLKI